MFGLMVGVGVWLGLGAGACLVKVDLRRPRPRHGLHFEVGTQAVVVLASRADTGPERRPLDVAEHAPPPALRGPVVLIMVASVLYKLEELSVGDLVPRAAEPGPFQSGI